MVNGANVVFCSLMKIRNALLDREKKNPTRVPITMEKRTQKAGILSRETRTSLRKDLAPTCSTFLATIRLCVCIYTYIVRFPQIWRQSFLTASIGQHNEEAPIFNNRLLLAPEYSWKAYILRASQRPTG